MKLILHKVRGEAAFDIAGEIPCPHCFEGWVRNDTAVSHCQSCEASGHWWIIPTSGHRAFPYWWQEIGNPINWREVPELPNNWPDHYPGPKAPPLVSTALELKDLDL